MQLPTYFKKSINKFPYQEVGEWKNKTAGGCGNNRDTYSNNPIYQLSLESYSDENDVCIDLKGPKYRLYV